MTDVDTNSSITEAIAIRDFFGKWEFKWKTLQAPPDCLTGPTAFFTNFNFNFAFEFIPPKNSKYLMKIDFWFIYNITVIIAILAKLC